ncbi:PP2C family protein-serine/threonine phosphatase [Nitrobacter sp. JJSN]|uniref:PP2C family protein-serine/threonine phosphatase n=1 Tax=Nitrobacter sp. JJSN TaxID=3453033 RepID=UPI003F761999
MATDRRVWIATHVGRVRSANEDLYLVGDRIGCDPIDAWSGTLAGGRGWAVIADGMGGHEGGKVASRVVVEAVAGAIDRAHDEASVTSMIDDANRRLFEEMYSGAGRPGMGTTIVGALFFDREALVFNVGDSRAYEIRRSRLLQLSRDDTLDADRSRRGGRSHALTQSLGGTTKPLALRPHIRRLPLEDHVGIMLCSDGLSDMVQEDEMSRLLSQSSGEPAESLVAAALEAGGKDNVTVIVIGSRT